jgi:hypothetical protein
LRGWIDRVEVDTGVRAGTSTDVTEELTQLRRENAELRLGERDLEDGIRIFRTGGARPPTFVNVAYIDAHKDRFRIEPICAVLAEHDMPIAPSTYHARTANPVSDTEWVDAHRANDLLDVWRRNWGVYGVDKCQAAMRRAGQPIGRDQTSRLMRLVGIRGAVRGRHRTVTTRSNPTAVRHPDLIGRAWSTPSRPDQWWVADFTYVWTLAGFAYTSFVTDVYSRRILGWRVSTSKTTPLVTAALNQALFPTPKPLAGDSPPAWILRFIVAHSRFALLARTTPLPSY